MDKQLIDDILAIRFIVLENNPIEPCLKELFKVIIAIGDPKVITSINNFKLELVENFVSMFRFRKNGTVLEPRVNSISCLSNHFRVVSYSDYKDKPEEYVSTTQFTLPIIEVPYSGINKDFVLESKSLAIKSIYNRACKNAYMKDIINAYREEF